MDDDNEQLPDRDMDAEIAVYRRLIQQATPADDAEAHMAARRIREIIANDARRVVPLAAVNQRARDTRRSWTWPVLAAAVLGATAASMVWLIGMRWHAGQPFREFVSAAGSRTTVTLRDGTQLVLGPASRLRVSGDFGRANRMVELDGEALFTVVHDAVHPFAVRTTHAVFHDIGTTFVVHAYAGDREDRIVVTEGRVGLEPIDANPSRLASRPTLSAHQAAVIDASGHIVLRSDIDPSDDLAWMQGRLVFNKTPLPEVVAELARTFDLTIRIADSVLVTRSITASFDNEPANEVLDDITRALGARYERAGHAVVIRQGAAVAGHRVAPSPAPALVTARSLASPQ